MRARAGLNAISQSGRSASGSASTYDYDSGLERLGMQKGGGTYKSYSTDAQGSVVGLEQDDGAIASNERYEYDPYGALQKKKGETGDEPEDSLSEDAKENPFRFQGFYYDSGVKTYDMRARSYRPELGRFLTSDRFESASGDFNLVADPLTQNRYAFAGGNPVTNVEWDGHDPHGRDTHARGSFSGRVSLRREKRAARALDQNYRTMSQTWRRSYRTWAASRSSGTGRSSPSTPPPPPPAPDPQTPAVPLVQVDPFNAIDAGAGAAEAYGRGEIPRLEQRRERLRKRVAHYTNPLFDPFDRQGEAMRRARIDAAMAERRKTSRKLKVPKGVRVFGRFAGGAGTAFETGSRIADGQNVIESGLRGAGAAIGGTYGAYTGAQLCPSKTGTLACGGGGAYVGSRIGDAVGGYVYEAGDAAVDHLSKWFRWRARP